MIKRRVCLVLLLLLFSIVGCSQGRSGNNLDSDTILTSDKIQAAELNDFYVGNQSKLILKLSNPMIPVLKG